MRSYSKLMEDIKFPVKEKETEKINSDNSEDLVRRGDVLKTLKACLLGGSSEYEYVKLHIDEIPTAFDLDKVVTELKAETVALEDDYGDFVECIPEHIAIKVVRKGRIG